MSGITTGTGIFSGIDSQSLINQLLQVESRPKILLQQRVLQLQTQQSAYLDINSRMNALKSAVAKFRESNIFKTNTATSSKADVLTATASNQSSQGSYNFLVDRLVTTRQLLSRGFGDSQSAAVGATAFTFESWDARLDRDVALADLNGGNGVARGKITITDSANRSATIDLSKAVYVSDVIDAINRNGTAQVTAKVVDDKIVLQDKASGALTVANASDSNTATSLGIAGTATGTLTGSSLLSLTTSTALATLNDGNGVDIKNTAGTGGYNFTVKVTRGGTTTDVKVNVGQVYEMQSGTLTLTKGAATTVGEVTTRINDALAAAGFSDVTASIAPDGKRLRLAGQAGDTLAVEDRVAQSTAKSLGLTGGASAGGVLSGVRIKSGIATTLAKSLNGGAGVAGDGVLHFSTRDGGAFDVTVSADATLAEIAQQIETYSNLGAGSTVKVDLNSNGTGLIIRDLTSGSSTLVISGNNGADTAASLGIKTDFSGRPDGVVTGTNLQKQWISRATLVTSLNSGRGIGTGQFRIVDSNGTTKTIDIGSDTKTLGDLIDEINGFDMSAKARINSTGDGIEIYDTAVPPGATKLKIEDVSGTVAKSLNIAGTAAGLDAQNTLNGTYERKVTFSAGDTLKQIADKINAAGAGVSAAIIKDGAGATPYRLSLSASSSGRAGRFMIDTGSFDLGLSTLDQGEDALVFYGSSDPAKAVALTSSTNTLDNIISGVKIDLKSRSDTAVSLSITRDTAAIETSVNDFITAFNSLISRIDTQSKYDSEAKKGGPLVGDSTVSELRRRLFSTLQSPPKGVTGRYNNLAQVGIKIGSGGALSLDSDAFRAALAEDPSAVEALFAARTVTTTSTATIPGLPDNITVRDTTTTYTSLGLMGTFEELAKSYLDSSSGILDRKKKTIDDQITAQNTRITAWDTRLDNRRTILEAQFLRMEKAIAQLQQQQNALGSLGKTG